MYWSPQRVSYISEKVLWVSEEESFRDTLEMLLRKVQGDTEGLGLGLVDLIWGVPPAGRPLL